MAGAKKRKDHAGHILKSGESEDKERRYHYKVMINGRRHTASANSLTELRAKEEQLQADIRDGIDTRAANDTLNDFFDRYLKTKLNIKPSTKETYRREWRCNVEHTIGQMKVADIRTSTLKVFYAGLAEGTQTIDGEKKKLNRGSIELLHTLIFSTLEEAVDDDVVRKNPARKAGESLGGDVRKKIFLSKEEMKSFLEFVKNDGTFNVYYPIFLFALSTGLRGGELLALQKSDVDLKAGTISVDKQLQYGNIGNGGAEFYITSTKTTAGTRIVPLLKTAREALAMQKENDFILDKVGKRQVVAGYSKYIFVSRTGKPYTVQRLDSSLDRIVAKHNGLHPDKPLPHISMHVLRRTFSNNCAAKHMNPKVLQQVMGHTKISTTLDIYARLDQSAIAEEMERLGDDIVRITG